MGYIGYVVELVNKSICGFYKCGKLVVGFDI